jgi:hypothetical protein
MDLPEYRLIEKKESPSGNDPIKLPISELQREERGPLQPDPTQQIPLLHPMTEIVKNLLFHVSDHNRTVFNGFCQFERNPPRKGTQFEDLPGTLGKKRHDLCG